MKTAKLSKEIGLSHIVGEARVIRLNFLAKFGSFMKNTYCLFQIKFITEYTNVQQVIITQILLKQFNQSN